jgi:hypothetical protein
MDNTNAKYAAIFLFFIVSLMVACQSTPATSVPSDVVTPQKPSSSKYTQCTEPRPQICTKEFRPVCATKDTSIRCVTTPCPSTKKSTYATGCVACSDPKVHGYEIGSCP